MATEKMSDPTELRKQFIETLYGTLEGVISPTPYLEIVEGDKVDVTFLDGRGRLPRPKATEITVLDIDIASLFFDNFNILYEGVTGVGKTYTSDALFDTIFGSDGHYTVRLTGGILGSSVLEPFTVSALEHGIPKTRIDQTKCKRYGALFIDEINRGDTQEVFQVVDGVIRVNGDTGRLGVPIQGTDRYKKLVIIAAMNPADAQHSGALELDLAGENRFLKFRFPNGVGEAASSQLDKKMRGSLHDKFWTEFEKRTGISGGWREHYPAITDPQQFAQTLDGQTREFMDVALGYVGYDPKETCTRNAELMTQGGVTSQLAVRVDNDYKKIIETQGTLKHGFVRRDLEKISNTARLLSFIKGIKDGTYDTAVRLNDVAAGIGIVLESKTVQGSGYGALMTLVNAARKAYHELREGLNVPEEYGVRQAIAQAAINAGTEHGFAAYVNTLQRSVAQMNTPASTAAQAAIKSRVLADLVVLDHFSKAHETDVTSALREKDGALDALAEVYSKKKAKGSVYEHRLDFLR